MLARLHVVNALHCGANLGVYSRYCCRNDTPRKHWLQQLCQTACRNSSVLANNNIFKPCVDCRDPMMLAVRVPVMHTFCQTACRSRFSQCSGVFAAGCCIPDAHRCSISKVAHVDELTTCRSWISGMLIRTWILSIKQVSKKLCEQTWEHGCDKQVCGWIIATQTQTKSA